MKWLLLFSALAFLLAGCSERVSYVCSDSSVVSNPSDCPPKEEAPISTPEVTTSDVYTLKVGESADVDGRKVTLKNVFADGRVLVEVSGVGMEFPSTKHLEIVSGLEVVIQSINFFVTQPGSSTAVLKINPFVPAPDEHILFVDEPQVVEDVKVTVKGITPSYIIVDTENVLGMKIYPGSSKVMSGINITNIRAFPHGIRSQDYVILKVVRA